jgi:hypothetical protein
MSATDGSTDEIERLRAEVGELRTVMRELWLRVADAGSLMLTSRVQGALEGSTDLSEEDHIPNAYQIPEHVRAKYSISE